MPYNAHLIVSSSYEMWHIREAVHQVHSEFQIIDICKTANGIQKLQKGQYVVLAAVYEDLQELDINT